MKRKIFNSEKEYEKKIKKDIEFAKKEFGYYEIIEKLNETVTELRQYGWNITKEDITFDII